MLHNNIAVCRNSLLYRCQVYSYECDSDNNRSSVMDSSYFSSYWSWIHYKRLESSYILSRYWREPRLKVVIDTPTLYIASYNLAYT